MSCRGTPGGRAASAAATAISGRSADDASKMMHKIRRQLRRNLDYEVAPATMEQLDDTLEYLAMQTRHTTGITEARRARVLASIDNALHHYHSGKVDVWPTNETLEAWHDLPARLDQLTQREEAAAQRAAERTAAQETDTAAKAYHQRFTRFNRSVVAATEELFDSRPSQLSHGERHAVFDRWLSKTSEAYGMTKPDLEWSTAADGAGGGLYQPLLHTIVLSPNRPSVITLIHETRHALQNARVGAPMVSEDVEVDARAWSLSLYYKVRPRLFTRLVREGRILHITEQDL